MSVIYKILDTVLPFAFLDYKFMKNAFVAVLLISPLLGMLGTMAVNNKMAFFSDALGHSAFTGIALGVMLGIDNELFSLLAFGIFMALVVTRVKASKTASSDTVISVFSSAAVALGLLILSRGGSFSSYSQYLIGDILSVSPSEILLLLIVFVVVNIVWYIIYNKLLFMSINADLAKSRGIRTVLVENTFVILLAVTVMLSIKWIGILLINSLLILPAAAARCLARNSRSYLRLSVLFSLVSSIGGLILSYYIDTSAGATISLLGAVIFFIAFACRRK